MSVEVNFLRLLFLFVSFFVIGYYFGDVVRMWVVFGNFIFIWKPSSDWRMKKIYKKCANDRRKKAN